MHISVVIPIYKCKSCINELHNRLVKNLSSITTDFEIILVNDNCPENSWEIISDLCKKDKRVKGINFSRNFGQHYAISAGLKYSSGDWIVVMDGDLQDRPEEISNLYNKTKHGYEMVLARRENRKDNFIKRLNSRIFYFILDFLSGTKTDHKVANFGIYSKKVINNFNKMNEQNRNFPLFIRWIGFDTGYVDVEHSKRYSGKTSYSLSKLINLAIDSIVVQTNKPLKMSIKLGFTVSFLSLLYGLYIIGKYYFFGIEVQGWASLVVSLYFLSGLIFANMGVLGLYLGKIFDEVKNRPLYVIKNLEGFDNEKNSD